MSKLPKTLSPQFLLVIIVAVVFSAIASYLIYDSFFYPYPSDVTLTGTVTSATGLKVGELITFTSLSSGNNYESYVSGGISGTYAVTLPNGNSYRVEVVWALKGDGGRSDLGILDLHSHDAMIQRNWIG